MHVSQKAYLVNVVPPRDKVWTPTEWLKDGPFYVYGDEDLKLRQEAAKEAGVTLKVRKAPKD